MFMTRWVRPWPSSVLFVLLAAIVLSVSASRGASAQTAPPAGIHPICDAATQGNQRFCPEVSAIVSNPAPGAKADVTTLLNIPAPQYNFRAVVTFIPEGWGVAADADIPDGAIVGQLSSSATLGFLNNPCSVSLPVVFDMMDAVTSTANQVTFADQFAVSGGLPAGVTKYPDYLARTFANEQGAITPLSRQYGQASVGGTNVSLNFVIFNRIEGLGYPSVAVLQNIGDPGAVPAPSPITDFCTPLSTEAKSFAEAKDNPSTSGNEGGATYRTNPASGGAYVFTTLAASLWDTNRNGIENIMDPCKHRNWNPADHGWDPRTSTYLPPAAACGLSAWPGDPQLGDVDVDTFPDRNDNCPWVANPDQKSTPRDGIGDACYQQDGMDPKSDPVSLGGLTYVGCRYSSVSIGGGGQPSNPQCPDLATLFQAVSGDGDNTVTDGSTPTPTPGRGVATPTPTPRPGAGGTVPGGTVGGPASGIGSLSPVASSVPAWAAALSALGGAGVLSGVGYWVSQVIRRRRQ